MNRCGRIALLFLIAPSALSAHGEQALLLPVGQVAALIVVVVLAFVLKMSAVWRFAFILSAIAASVGSWFIPNLYFVFLDWFGTSGWPWFTLGLVAPVGAAVAIYLGSRRMARHDHR